MSTVSVQRGGELIGMTGWKHIPKEFLTILQWGTLEGQGRCFPSAQMMLRTSFSLMLAQETLPTDHKAKEFWIGWTLGSISSSPFPRWEPYPGLGVREGESVN